MERDKLIYDLIFSEKLEFRINIGDYINDIYRYDYFITDIKKILKKSKVTIMSETLGIDPKYVIWALVVKK